VLASPGWPDYVFAFHDSEEIGPKMLARIAKHTGLAPEDL
jgi:predicted RNA binding protein YcfA (HicA-like mRNA interferase family)